MTLTGRQAVRKAFENASGMAWSTVRDEYIATRLETFFDPFRVECVDADGIALDLVRRAYLQGLREADQVGGETRAARAELARRETQYAQRLMSMFDGAVEEWVTDEERRYVQSSIQAAYRAGCDEGRLPLGSVI